MMKMRKLGQALVPAVGLGCMGMSEFYGATDDKTSMDTLHAAFDMGYRHFDTADMYGKGHNEQLVGSFVRQLRGRRDTAFIATKGGIVRDPADKYSVSVKGSRDYIRNACEQSLRRLDLDHIDLYYLHRLDPGVELAESIGTMAELVKEGKIGAIGLCEISASQLEQAHAIHPIAAVQSELSLWSRDAEAAVLPTCLALGVAFVAFSPLGRGFLSGAIGRDFMQSASSELDFRTRIPRFSEENLDRNSALVSQLAAVAAELDVSPSQLALQWALARGPHIHIIPGTKTPRYLASNFKAQYNDLGTDVIARLDRIFDPQAVAGSRYPQKILEKSAPAS